MRLSSILELFFLIMPNIIWPIIVLGITLIKSLQGIRYSWARVLTSISVCTVALNYVCFEGVRYIAERSHDDTVLGVMFVAVLTVYWIRASAALLLIAGIVFVIERLKRA